jgi:trehalose 6-phosphate synthase
VEAVDTTRLVVVSNRLAVVVEEVSPGAWTITPGAGGLVTALGPVLRDRGGTWIGWLGTTAERLPSGGTLDDLVARASSETGYELVPVDLTEQEVEKYYDGFSNEILWPLFHDLPSRCNFDPRYWEFYETVNAKFAAAIARYTRQEEDFVWVHDYHLMRVSQQLKAMGIRRHTGFFLHIPFPPLDGFLKLPWRFDILEGLLAYDLVGFQTMRDRRNFLDCVRTLRPGARTVGHGHVCKLIWEDWEVLVGAFPISIDFRDFARLAATPEVADTAWIIHANLPERQLILGVDRLDYTKGIPNRFLAFADALDRHPELRRRVTLIQVVVPSRQTVPEYEALKREIERLVGHVNGRFTEVGWTPIHYIFRSLGRPELVAYYRTCEMALITPLKDGMNLVAKEYCTCNVEGNGVLILSEFAGSAAQLHTGALIVNPFDVREVADAIHRACHMSREERTERMRRLRRTVKRHDIFEWVNDFLHAAIAKDLAAFPRMELFVPKPRAL